MNASRLLLASLLALPVVVSATGCEVATFSEDARRKGLALYNQGNFTDAAGSFHNAVRQRPTDYQSHYYLGQSFEKLGQNQRAIAAYKSARDTQLQTGDGIRDHAFRERILDALASAIANSADRDAEIKLLKDRAATARNGEDYILLARVFRAGQDPDNAVASYNEAHTRYPREFAYAKEYGLYLKSLGLTDRARTVLTAASRLRPDAEVNAALAGL